MDEGDVVLLFFRLPYNYDDDLPITIVPALEIAETPFSALNSTSEEHMSCYVLPGHKLPGMGINHCCLVSPISCKPPVGISRDALLFLFITALRLIAPAIIEISGQFEYGGEEDPIRNPRLYNMRSTWQPAHDYSYCGLDFVNAGKLLIPIINCMNGNLGRLKYAFMLFSQVTCGFSLSYQMSVLALFAALEALFAPHKGNYGMLLGSRVGRYLAKFDTDRSLEKWLSDQYIRERHSLSHGFWQFSPDVEHTSERNMNFGKLHEIVRLCLLGFLSEDADNLSFMFLRGRKLQSKLDNLPPANGIFLQGQHM